MGAKGRARLKKEAGLRTTEVANLRRQECKGKSPTVLS